MGGKTPHLEGEGQVELIIFQWNSFDSCTRQISASFGIFNIFINSKQVLKDRRLLLKSNEGICAFIKKTWQLMSNEQMISFHGYFLFLLIDHTDRSHVNETFHPISATPHRGFYFLNHGRFSRIPADCHFRLSPSTSAPITRLSQLLYWLFQSPVYLATKGRFIILSALEILSLFEGRNAENTAAKKMYHRFLSAATWRGSRSL